MPGPLCPRCKQHTTPETTLRFQQPFKLYSFDMGWAGMIVTVASNKEEAEKKIKGNYACRNWVDGKSSVEEHEIKDGTTISSLGDQ